jgi:GR25 family glycosyltransferase involved in LPS biosynthesis
MCKNIEMQYYLIHGPDFPRKARMEGEFAKWNLDNEKVKWITYPNKNELTQELVNSIVNMSPSVSCGLPKGPGYMLQPGVISCTYKHYLAVKDMVENGYSYGIIMEDNMYYTADIPETVNKYISQLNDLYPEWDIIFDSDYVDYYEGKTRSDVYVYPKSNEISDRGHGGTRCAQFYILTQSCAKKLYANYLPFNNSPDWFMNDLFRKLDIHSFWAQPPFAKIAPHQSTADGDYDYSK